MLEVKARLVLLLRAFWFWIWGIRGVEWRMEESGTVREEDATVGVVVRVARGSSRGRDLRLDAIVCFLGLSVSALVLDR